MYYWAKSHWPLVSCMAHGIPVCPKKILNYENDYSTN